MKPNLTKHFLRIATWLVFCVGIAKVASSSGHNPVLDKSDPLLLISFRHVFWSTGICELLIASYCAFGSKPDAKLLLLAWLSTVFAIYKIGLTIIGYQGECPCLGSLTEAIHISGKSARAISNLILLFLLIGSYAGIYFSKPIAPRASEARSSSLG